MIDEQNSKMSNDGVSRRSFLAKTSAAPVAAASLPIVAAAQQTKDLSRDTHTAANEQEVRPPERASASSGEGKEAGGGGEWSGSQ
jgi:oxalate decarboxylase